VAVLVVEELNLDDVVDEIVLSNSDYDVLAQLQVIRVREAGRLRGEGYVPFVY